MTGKKTTNRSPFQPIEIATFIATHITVLTFMLIINVFVTTIWGTNVALIAFANISIVYFALGWRSGNRTGNSVTAAVSAALSVAVVTSICLYFFPNPAEFYANVLYIVPAWFGALLSPGRIIETAQPA